jgi:hypothetical protein
VLRAASGEAMLGLDSAAADWRGVTLAAADSLGMNRLPPAGVAGLKKPLPAIGSGAGRGVVLRSCGARLACRTRTGRPSSERSEVLALASARLSAWLRESAASGSLTELAEPVGLLGLAGSG